MPQTIIVCPFDKKMCGPKRAPNGDIVLSSWYKIKDNEPEDGIGPGRCMFLDLYDKLALLG